MWVPRLTILSRYAGEGGEGARKPGPESKNHPRRLVGRTPWSAADDHVGLLAPCKMLISLFRQRDEGVPRGPGVRPTKAGYRAAGGSWSVGTPATWRKNATDRLIQDASCPMVRLLAFLPVRAML